MHRLKAVWLMVLIAIGELLWPRHNARIEQAMKETLD